MLEIIILAIALSMDAFAVSIGLGIKSNENLKTLAIKAGLFFGFFQALMPFIGYFGGI
jgi:putative Mn2+ efflux pump MntP